jgi:hypothetical protein
MFAESDRVLSRVSPKFFALCTRGYGGVVNCDGKVLERAGFSQ